MTCPWQESNSEDSPFGPCPLTVNRTLARPPDGYGSTITNDVPLAGVEPAASRFVAGRSIQMSYRGGVLDGSRTRDLLGHIQTLYQLSYEHSVLGEIRTRDLNLRRVAHFRCATRTFPGQAASRTRTRALHEGHHATLRPSWTGTLCPHSMFFIRFSLTFANRVVLQRVSEWDRQESNLRIRLFRPTLYRLSYSPTSCH